MCLDRYIFGAARIPGLRSRPVTTLVSMRYVVVREGFPWVQTLAWTALAAGIAGAAGRASQRLLWNDELFTLYTSQLASVDIFKALATGLDLHPPAGYFVLKATTLTFGDGLVQARLCSLAGFVLACLAIGRFVGRAAGTLPGTVAMLIPFVTGAYDYAFEARPYAPMLGLSAVALACWQATSGPRRRVALVALGLTIATLVSFHYFGTLLVVAIAAGEFARGRAAQRPGVWMALGAGLLPLVCFLPLLHAGAAYGGAFWTRPSPGQLLYTYRLFLFPSLLPAAIVLAVWSLLSLRRRDPQVELPEDGRAFTRDELAVCAALFMLPVAALATAYVLGAYHARYSIAMVLGFAGLVAGALAGARSARLAVVTSIVLALWVTGRGIVAAMPLLTSAPAPDVLTLHPLLRSARLPPVLPIVVSDVATFVQLEHYAPPTMRSRLRAITAPLDNQAPEYYEDSSLRALDSLSRWHHVAVVRYDDLVRGREPFLAYGDGSWLPRRLSRDGARLELIGATFEKVLILVTPGS